jgi:hypothetical protein
MVFFGEIYAFLQVCWIGLFGANIAYTHLENCDLEEVFITKINSILTKNNVLDTTASHGDGCLRRDTCDSSYQLNRSIWNKMSISLTWKLWFSGSIPFRNEINFYRETMCYNILLLTQMVFFRDIHVFPQLCWTGQFGANSSYIHLENYDFQEVFLSKTNWIVTGQQHTRCSCL